MSPEDQAKILKQFREALVKEDLHDGDSIGTDDETLLRFLRARQFNLKNAKTMWKNCYQWRKTAEGVGIDELYRRIDPFDYPERDHVFKFWPLFFHKVDKRGRPINIHHFGRINTTELYKGISPERFWQAFLVNADSLTREVLPAADAAAGKRIDGTFVIVDLKGFGTGQFWQMKNLARGAFQVSQDYFPETMSQLAIINAPSSFTLIWSIMRPWMAKETQDKVSILGSNYASALLKLIDADSLPKSLGGECTCADCGNIGEKKPEVGGMEGQEDMGRCAFSSAGPWMVGRAQRKEAWMRGERPLGMLPGELEEFAKKEGADPESLKTHPDPTVEEGKRSLDAEGESSDEYSGPSTPALEQQMSRVSIHGDSDSEKHQSHKEPLTTEESVKIVTEQHPDTRTVQTGGLLPSS
ncbi:CRAL/TRIO domain-containing protein [Trametopsis cervina]|nr:CRAL/TRIO domain-containing protein [Trametopsis cervina]